MASRDRDIHAHTDLKCRLRAVLCMWTCCLCCACVSTAWCTTASQAANGVPNNAT